jgi:uncharacterized protein YqeY
MTDLRTRLTDDMKTAMKAGDKLRLETIRLIIAKMKEVDINARAAGKPAAEDADLMSMLQGMLKQRAESAKIYRDNGRAELAEKEEAETVVIQSFMPAQLSDDQAALLIAEMITSMGATGIKDMGRVMAAVREKLAGQFDMTKASGIVKAKLAG